MKKKICTLLTLCLTLCTVFYLPTQAAEETSAEFPEAMVSPLTNNSGYLAGVVEDEDGYWYLLTCTTVIGGTEALVSTSFALMDHQMPSPEFMDEYAKQVKGVSSFGSVSTLNGASDSFGATGFADGKEFTNKQTKIYSWLVLSLNGSHGFGCKGKPDLRYNTNAYVTFP